MSSVGNKHRDRGVGSLERETKGIDDSSLRGRGRDHGYRRSIGREEGEPNVTNLEADH